MPGKGAKGATAPIRKSERLKSTSVSDTMDISVDSFERLLEEDRIKASLMSIFKAATQDMADDIKRSHQVIDSLKHQLQAKDVTIHALQGDVGKLTSKVEDLEQYSRRASMRVFGLPEDSHGSLEDKLLSLFNDELQMSPKMTVDEMEVVHRVQKAPAESGAPQDGRPKPVLIKFASRRSKQRAMSLRKKLKSLGGRREDARVAQGVAQTGDAEADDTAEGGAGVDPGEQRRVWPWDVWFSDDLTRARAKLAYLARDLRRKERVRDTWVFDCKVLVKDNMNRIKEIRSEADIRNYQPQRNQSTDN